TLELALLKMAQMRRLAPFAELVARVDRLASGVAAPPLAAPPLAAAPAPPARAASAAPASAANAPAAAPKAPAAAAPAAPPAAAAASADPASIVAAMVGLAQARPSLALPLRTAQARQEGDTLVIEVAPDFAALAAMHVDEYRELARTASGRPLNVRIGAGPAPEAAPPSSAEASRRRLTDEAVRAPAVQEALDLF